MPYARLPNSGNDIFQVDPDALLTTYPNFYAASADIHEAATHLHQVLNNAVSAFDGDTQKKLQTLGNTCVTNLQGLASALNEIASRLQKSTNAIQHTESNNTHMF